MDTNLEFESQMSLKKAANRFILIFKPENLLPAFFTPLMFHVTNNNTIEWTTARETNIVDYSAYSEFAHVYY
jgi:hypothetical protein